MVLASSCVNDDTFFPDNTGSEKITSTTALITVLNDLKTRNEVTDIVESDLCFTFKYPIILGYNNDSTIKINDFRGLIGATLSQSENFNIIGLQFPVEIVFRESNSVFRVENDEALVNVLRECQVKTFREDFNTLYRQCFKFEYPITLNDKEKNEITIDNDQGVDSFLLDQGVGYQPDFKFPIKISVAPDFKTTELSSYYEFYEIINDCVGCPDIRFEIKALSDNIYQFIPDIEIKDGYQLFFKINNEVIPDQVINGNSFTRQFYPGAYEVCIKAITPDCPDGIEFCKELVVEPICPEITYAYEQVLTSNIYRFTPSVVGLDGNVTIGWYVNDVFIKDELLSAQLVEIELSLGRNVVCARIETQQCPNGAQHCKEIVLE